MSLKESGFIFVRMLVLNKIRECELDVMNKKNEITLKRLEFVVKRLEFVVNEFVKLAITHTKNPPLKAPTTLHTFKKIMFIKVHFDYSV